LLRVKKRRRNVERKLVQSFGELLATRMASAAIRAVQRWRAHTKIALALRLRHQEYGNFRKKCASSDS